MSTSQRLTPRNFHRLLSLAARVERAVEFGPLGSPVAYRKPLVGDYDIPMGTGLYIPPTGVRIGKGTDARARRGGAVLNSAHPVPEPLAKLVGYEDAASLKGAVQRHEIVHSIQAAKRGYRAHSKIRDLLKDEVGAYATMNRGVKGGNPVTRAIHATTGVAKSTVVGTLNNPRLRKRAAVYGAGAALIGGGLLAVKKLRESQEETKRDFEAAPIRDARTGTYTARGTISGPTLRKAWGATAPAASAAVLNPARERFKQALVQTLRDSRNPVK